MRWSRVSRLTFMLVLALRLELELSYYHHYISYNKTSSKVSLEGGILQSVALNKPNSIVKGAKCLKKEENSH